MDLWSTLSWASLVPIVVSLWCTLLWSSALPCSRLLPYPIVGLYCSLLYASSVPCRRPVMFLESCWKPHCCTMSCPPEGPCREPLIYCPGPWLYPFLWQLPCPFLDLCWTLSRASPVRCSRHLLYLLLASAVPRSRALLPLQLYLC